MSSPSVLPIQAYADVHENIKLNDLDAGRKRRLRIWNFITALIHLITGVAIAGLTDRKITYPWYVNFPTDVSERGTTGFLVPAPKKVADIAVGYFSSVFLLLAFLDHFLVILPGLNGLYNRQLAQNQNQFRWAEYSFSASIMHVEIAMLSGVSDIHLLFAIFGLTAITMVFGGIFESVNSKIRGTGKSKQWSSFWLGFIPHLFNWSIIWCYFFYGVRQADPPGFVWAIIFVLTFLDLTFAINLGLQWLEVGPWRDYIKGEWVFIVLSLTAKQLLAWINYGGSQR